MQRIILLVKALQEDIDHVIRKISQTSKNKSNSINVQHIHLYNNYYDSHSFGYA